MEKSQKMRNQRENKIFKRHLASTSASTKVYMPGPIDICGVASRAILFCRLIAPLHPAGADPEDYPLSSLGCEGG